ncbi:MAG: sel1 repeat family protein [Phascolarctobacterium sp.]|nr:sel1 repeat family protein [Phascolarctobacterium sp.]
MMKAIFDLYNLIESELQERGALELELTEFDPLDLLEVADLYEGGKQKWGIKENKNLALKIYKVAAEMNTEPIFNWGKESVSRLENFFVNLQKASQGDVEALYQIGMYYFDDLNDELCLPYKDNRKACKYFKMAAELGHISAQYELGYCYKEGCGVERNIDEAVKWYRMVAEQGMAEAQYELAELYAQGREIEKNIIETQKWYKAAAEQGYDEDVDFV